jgi:hypothetical protein
LELGLLEAAATAWIAIYASLLSDPQSLYDNKMVIDAFRIIGLETVPSTEILLIAGSALMAFLIAAKNALRGLSRYLTGHYSASVSALFGKRLMHRYLYRPYSWYLTQKGSELQQTVEWRIFVSEFLLNILQALSDLIIVVFLVCYTHNLQHYYCRPYCSWDWLFRNNYLYHHQTEIAFHS